jgi:hypothetical protein
MRILIYISLLIVGVGFIYWGAVTLKKGKDSVTLINKRLFFFGVIGIILGLLGLFNIIPWEKY